MRIKTSPYKDKRIALYNDHCEHGLHDIQKFCFSLGFDWVSNYGNKAFVDVDNDKLILLNQNTDNGRKPYLTHTDTPDDSEVNVGTYHWETQRKEIFYKLEWELGISVPDDIIVYIDKTAYTRLGDIIHWLDFEKRYVDKEFVNDVKLHQWYKWGDRERLNSISYEFDEFLKTGNTLIENVHDASDKLTKKIKSLVN